MKYSDVGPHPYGKLDIEVSPKPVKMTVDVGPHPYNKV